MEYDLIIIGSGAAGMSAAIYAARYHLKTLIISESFGGLIVKAHKVENWPGDISISGMDLMTKFSEHVKSLGVEIKNETVLDFKDGVVITNVGTYKTKYLLLGLGMKRRKLNIKGEKEFEGKGVSYCVTCDGPFFRDTNVGVVGGSDSAAQAAILLAEYGNKVKMIYRRDKLRCEPTWEQRILDNPNIEVIFNANVVEIKGENLMDTVVLDNGSDLKLEGLFIEVGFDPKNELIEKLGVETEDGFIKVNSKMETNIKHVYASGDITTGSNKLKQVITAAAEGAIAANEIFKSTQS